MPSKPNDFEVANASGAAVRADLNNIFGALRSNNGEYSGAPTTKYKYMWYADVGGTGKMSFYKANASQKIDFISLTDGNFFGPNGSASSPSYTFTNSPSTGLFTSTTNQIDIATNGTNRFRIAANGGVFLGKGMTQDPVSASGNVGSGIKFVAASSAEYDSFGLVVNAKNIVGIFNRTQSTGKILEFKYNGSTIVGEVTTNGFTTQYVTNPSDRTLKKNFESWNENTLDLFKNLNPQQYNFINQEDTSEKNKGFIAQEVVDSFPEAYPQNDKGKYMFNPSGMVVYLMKALQESVAKIETLEAKVAALEAK